MQSLLEYNTVSIQGNISKTTITMHTKYMKRELWLRMGQLISSIIKAKLLKKKLSKSTEPNIIKYKTFNNIYNTTRRQLEIRYYDYVFNSNNHIIKQTLIEL
ncbi:hypothetical protein LSH36_633g01006 [Paralvinella palmiformis]|uniref:Uncharacterized protein n=1 Tax=Paralvinella palmiformis TaxID=53620 RepID=A0AAD9J5K8_9ANNE|nr:hypothetical protein LSH36_633g01006 [Paralvinella palmiformis]